MRILIASDLHANIEAVRSLPRDFDELWLLGDLVNYGPNPCEVIEFARANASLIVRGNHDHAVGHGADTQCSPRCRRMAEETGRFSRSAITPDQREFLKALPLTAARIVRGVRFALFHGTPENPLYEYQRDPAWWDRELGHNSADVLLVGHTHKPFCRGLGGRIVANPGSVGQPKHGAPRVSYAIWEEGDLRLESVEYPVPETVKKVEALAIAPEVRADLITVLETGSDQTLD